MLTGSLPFEDRNPLAVMYKHAHEPPPDLRTRTQTPLPDALCEAVLRSLAKNPEQRWAHAREMRLALEAVLSGQATSARTVRYQGTARGDEAIDPTTSKPLIALQAGAAQPPVLAIHRPSAIHPPDKTSADRDWARETLLDPTLSSVAAQTGPAVQDSVQESGATAALSTHKPDTPGPMPATHLPGPPTGLLGPSDPTSAVATGPARVPALRWLVAAMGLAALAGLGFWLAGREAAPDAPLSAPEAAASPATAARVQAPVEPSPSAVPSPAPSVAAPLPSPAEPLPKQAASAPRPALPPALPPAPPPTAAQATPPAAEATTAPRRTPPEPKPARKKAAPSVERHSLE